MAFIQTYINNSNANVATVYIPFPVLRQEDTVVSLYSVRKQTSIINEFLCYTEVSGAPGLLNILAYLGFMWTLPIVTNILECFSIPPLHMLWGSICSTVYQHYWQNYIRHIPIYLHSVHSYTTPENSVQTMFMCQILVDSLR